MDVLTDVLNTLLFQANFYFRTDLTLPWSVHVPAKTNVARYHIITRGQGWIQVDGEGDFKPVTNGDLVLIPHGAGHTIADNPETPARPLDNVLADVSYTGTGPLVYGGGGPNTGLVCGEICFDDAVHPLLQDLPPLLHLTASEMHNRMWLDNTLGLIAYEAHVAKTGSLAIINRLAEIIFIQAIRALADASAPDIPFLAALADPQISLALAEIHRDPAVNWSIEKLGRTAGMSRSMFSNRFTELVGRTPHQYLTLIRMQHASRALLASDESIFTVALATGYKSEAAFSTAFKRFFNIRPGEYRKRHRQKDVA